MNYSRDQIEDQHQSSADSQQQKPVKAVSNSQALEQLQGNNSARPNVNLSSATDGPSFSSAAAAALEAIVPGEGSTASMKLTGTIPLYKTVGLEANLMPSLALEARRSGGKLSATITSELALRAQAGTEGSFWWPKFLAYFQAKIKGSIKITGDSAEEIFDEFMMSLRYVVENACDACGAPSKIKNAMAGALMSKAAMQQTIAGMDEKDSVDLTLGGGVEAGVDTSLGSTKGSLNFDYTKSLGKDNASDQNLRIKNSNKTTASVGITFKADKLGASVPCSFNFIYKNGIFDEWNFKVGLSKSMNLGDFSKEMLITTEWLSDMANSMSNAIYQANKGVNNPNMARVAGQIGSMAIGPEAVKYTALGEGLKNVAASPSFGDKMGMGVKFDIKGQAGWSKSKGWNTALSLETSKSMSLGKAGVSPLAIDLKSSDKILTFAAGTAKGVSFGS